MKKTWRDLGSELGFLPVWQGLAAVETDRPAPGHDGVPLPGRVRGLVEALRDRGYHFPMVVVPCRDKEPEVGRAVRRAGGSVLVVPEAYWSGTEAERIAVVAGIHPDPRLARPAREARVRVEGPREPFDESRYRGPSSRHDAREIAAWAKRVSDPGRGPAEGD